MKLVVTRDGRAVTVATQATAAKPRPKPAPSHLASCVHCKAEARILHARTHLSPEALAQIRKTERAYAALEVEFQHERVAELAAKARGMRPVPGQWKLDQQRLALFPEPLPEVAPLTVAAGALRPSSPLVSNPKRLLKSLEWLWHDEPGQPIAQPALVVYRDLWHGEALS